MTSPTLILMLTLSALVPPKAGHPAGWSERRGPAGRGGPGAPPATAQPQRPGLRPARSAAAPTRTAFVPAAGRGSRRFPSQSYEQPPERSPDRGWERERD